MKKNEIGFVGLGNIGMPMTANLLKAGYEVLGYDVKPNPAFTSQGGVQCDFERLRQAQVVIFSLPNAAALRSTVDALVVSAGALRVIVDLSSYHFDDKLAQAQRLAERGIAMLDCEVSGLPAQVAQRKAVIFKSGDGELIESLAPVFDAMADQHFHVGPFGAATQLKLIANTMVCVHNLMAAEALNLGARAGLDPALIARVIGPSAAGSTTFANKVPLMLSREFDGGNGPFRHMFGYLARAQEMASACGAHTPLLHAARELYSVAERDGMHDQDIAAVLDVLERHST